MVSDSWKGEELISKIWTGSAFILWALGFFLFDLLTPKEGEESNPLLIVVIFLAIGLYISGMYGMTKTIEYNRSQLYGGKKYGKGRNNLGRGRLESFKWLIKDHYPLDEASEYFRAAVSKAEKAIVKAQRAPIKTTETEILFTPIVRTYEDQKLFSRLSLYFSKERRLYLERKRLERLQEMLNTNEKKNDKKTKDKETKEKESLNKLTEIELREKYIELVAEDLKRQFYHEEILSAKEDRKDGASVHGYLIMTYGKRDYKRLIRRDFVLDLAAYKSRKDYRPRVNSIVDMKDLNNCVKTVLVLEKENQFDCEPDFPYQHVVLYADKDLNNAVVWKPGVEQTIYNFLAKVELGFFNIITFSKAMWNIPMCRISHGPGSNEIVKKVEIDEKKAKTETVNADKELLAKQNDKIIELKEMADDFRGSEETWRKLYTKTRNKLEILTKREVEEELDSFIKEDTEIPKFDLGNVLLIIAVIAIVIFIFVVMVVFSGQPPVEQVYPKPITSSVIQLIQGGFR